MTRRPLYPTVRKQPGRARIIRKVKREGRDGQPKVVRDYDESIDVERVTPQRSRPCAAGDECLLGGFIVPEMDPVYIQVKYLYPQYRDRIPRRRMRKHQYQDFPLTEAYHTRCVPAYAQRCLRFFR